jgi:hypothetical protein
MSAMTSATTPRLFSTAIPDCFATLGVGALVAYEDDEYGSVQTNSGVGEDLKECAVGPAC